MTTPIDPRVLAGMKVQLEKRRTLIAAGAKRLGWKAGFGAPAALAKFELAGPLMGFLLDTGRLASGAEVKLAGWAKPVAEPEIAVHIGTTLADGCDPAKVRAAVAALGPAIELADLDPPPAQVEAVLACNIYHRHVLLGPRDAARVGGSTDGLIGTVRRTGQPDVVVTEFAANTGRLLDVVAHLANTLAACDERLEAGDVIIAGSVVPPIFLTPEDRRVEFELGGIGKVEVRLQPA